MTDRRGLWLAAGVALLALLVTLIAAWPLRAALSGAPLAGLSAERVEGTVWNGRLIGARLRGLDLGDVEARVSAIGLLSGRLDARLAASQRGLNGRVSRSGEQTRIDALTGAVSLSQLGTGLPGSLQFDGLSVTFEGPTCRTASGRVSSDGATQLLARYGLEAPVLTGEARCRQGDLLLPLAGAGSGLTVRADLAIQGDGRFSLDMVVRVDDPALAEVVAVEIARSGAAAGGFRPGAEGLTLTLEGRL